MYSLPTSPCATAARRADRTSPPRVHLASGPVTDERIELVDAPYRVRYRVLDGWGRAIDAFVAATYGEHQLEALYDGRTLVTWRGWIVPRNRLARPVVKLLSGIILSPMFRRYLRAIDRAVVAA